MKIGVFDSGLGGLVIAKSFMDKLPQYDYVYFGDNAHLPYGEKTPQEVLDYTLSALRFLIKQECRLIILACNTASCIALRYIQQKYIPATTPDIKVLGVIVPTVEQALQASISNIAVVATPATVKSNIYEIELKKINPSVRVTSVATPELVPAIEQNDFVAAKAAIQKYVPTLSNCSALILGCTHYPLIKPLFQGALPQIQIISQDDFMGDKLADYLQRHPEIEQTLSKNQQHSFFVTKDSDSSENVARLIFPTISLQTVQL